jgi:glycosyltransferase involved in cell wall biosynthesis
VTNGAKVAPPAEATILNLMKPLRVAVVADGLLLAMSGVSRSILGVSRELARLDPDRVSVTLVARRRPPSIDGLPYRRSFSPRVPRLPDPLFALQRPFTLRSFDIVHYMDSRPPFDFPIGPSLKVITQHGFAPLLFPKDVPRRVAYVNRSLAWLARHADLTFTPSESERRHVLERTKLDPSRVVAVHHGVDHDRFRPPADPAAAREELRRRIGIQGRYVFFTANDQYKKNPERLVEAFSLVARDVPDVTLALAGWHTPRFQGVLDLIDTLGVSDRVRVLGHLGDAELELLYGCASVFVLPSLHESFGMPVLEAMACGAPVVTSNVYSLPEVCAEAAEYVDPYDVNSIAAGLRRVLDDPARSEDLRRLGFERAAGFTWRKSAEHHLESYERALLA